MRTIDRTNRTRRSAGRCAGGRVFPFSDCRAGRLPAGASTTLGHSVSPSTQPTHFSSRWASPLANWGSVRTTLSTTPFKVSSNSSTWNRIVNSSTRRHSCSFVLGINHLLVLIMR